MLHVATVSIELIHLLRPLVERIRRRDKGLSDQIVRAANSIALNIGEADRSQGATFVRAFTARRAAPARRARRCAWRWPGVTKVRRRRAMRSATWIA
jgi:hypothetical protein